MACLLCYGLIPRIITLTISRWSARRAIDRVKLDHGDFYKLKDRLTRPLVQTQATSPEVGVEDDAPRRDIPRQLPARSLEMRRTETPPASEPPPSPLAVSRSSPDNHLPQRHVVQWAGVQCDREEVGRLIKLRLRVEPAEVFTVGDLQAKGDKETLQALGRDGQTEVLLVVESWEPPIADYVDFLSDLRSVVGRERMIVVLLYNRDPAGNAVAPRPRDVQIWRDQIATLGDPWICVEELVEGKREVEESKVE
jgi:hypothetical protein